MNKLKKMIDFGLISICSNLLRHPKRQIKKETTWILSNITAGTQAQIQSVIDAKCIDSLIKLFDSEMYIKREVGFALVNITIEGNLQQIRALTSHGVVKAFCKNLLIPEAKLVSTLLQGLENILKTGEGLTKNGVRIENPYRQEIEDCGGLDKLEQLQELQNEDIYKSSIRILENYFECEEVNDENEPPNTFNFQESKQSQKFPPKFVF